MQRYQLTTPVLFLIFNRPDITYKVFNEIKKAKPKHLFISADGPRKNVKSDIEKCKLTRNIIKQIDWDCQVKTNYYKNNLGCNLAITSAINWFFKHVDRGIILEDDCLPNQSFFWFCQKLLKKYKDDERIMMISGNSYQFNRKIEKASYYFSKLPTIWGWATWRRSWNFFDLNVKDFPKFNVQKRINNIFNDRITQNFWLRKIFGRYSGRNTWDFAWAYAMFKQYGLCICPKDNLVSNIGFGPDASNTKHHNSVLEKIRTKQINKIIHPSFIIPDIEVDRIGTIIAAKEQMPTLFLTKKIIHKILPMITHIVPNTWRKKLIKSLFNLV